MSAEAPAASPVPMGAVTAFARAASAAQHQLQSAGVSAHIFRSRARVISRQMPTAVVVRLQQADSHAAVGQGMWMPWQSVLIVDCYARGTPESDADLVLDQLLAAAATALQTDRTLGGVVGDISPAAVAWDFDVDGDQTACATVTFIVQHFVGAVHLD